MQVSETFYSIQGEGPTTGVPSYFIRTGGCNLLCGGPGTQKDGELHNGATWRCDTIEVWKNFAKMSNQEIVKQLGGTDFYANVHNGAHIIFTGGEPLMQQDELISFIEFVTYQIDKHPYIEIETNGTIEPKSKLCALVDQWNVSPKLANSGMREKLRIKNNPIVKLRRQPNVIFKFVISSDEDHLEMEKKYVEPFNLRRDTIFLMPAGETRELLRETSELTVELCKKWGYRFTGRLHIEIWNKKTGV